ncbi:hypothetical protein [Eleftheria terrae]|uniref:hypothetical protein n=1 Tax=Eleftheria terrae TaxID=1597781 RepID=UPI00263B11DD|nr:hypothetical protein [Eleftheria terrae]WKB54969.1 hypothetical protein N7L95_11570 [Eleftheria terrae]
MSELTLSPLVYAKTDAGRRALSERRFAGTPAQRALFILLDGRQPLRRLAAAARALGVGMHDVEALAALGYIAPAQAAAAPGAAAAAALPPIEPAPMVSRTTPRSLAAAKFYALEQVGRMLGQADAALREAAREVADRDSLLRWLQDCRHALQQVAGEERAGLFLARVQELLPEEDAAALPR